MYSYLSYLLYILSIVFMYYIIYVYYISHHSNWSYGLSIRVILIMYKHNQSQWLLHIFSKLCLSLCSNQNGWWNQHHLYVILTIKITWPASDERSAFQWPRNPKAYILKRKFRIQNKTEFPIHSLIVGKQLIENTYIHNRANNQN